LGLFVLGCVRPAEERAKRDLEVGKAKNGELSVHVSHGLAAVRTLESGHLVLWSSAPGWTLELDASAAMTLRLDVRNAMPDAELTSLATDAAVTALQAEPLTHKSFDLTLPAGTSSFRFAAPDSGERGAFHFALMSDVQEAIDRVSDIYDRMNEEPDIRFLLGAGDLTRRGTVSELQRFEDELLRLEVPYYTTLGNHELGTSPCRYQDHYGRGNFQFAFRGVHFTMLDSASATLDPLVYDWLDAWLANAKNGVSIVAMHIPPLDPTGVRNGAFASRGEAAALLATLAEARVDLTLYGHIHSHYEFTNAGIPAYISGGGGAIPERFDDIGRHFMVIEVDADRGVTGTRVVRVDPDD
jgi:3',5'-cyclic AMP phosphodiesterase CpdA